MFLWLFITTKRLLRESCRVLKAVGLYLVCDIYCKYVIIATMLLLGYIFVVELTFPISQHSNYKHARLGAWLSLFSFVSFFIYANQILNILSDAIL